MFAAPCFALLFAFPDRYSAVAEIGTWSFLLFTIPLLRQAARIGMSKLGMWTLPTVLVASNSRLANMHDAIQNNVSLGYDVRWVIIEDPEGEMPASVTGPARLYMTKPSETAFALADSGCMQAIIATDEVQSTTYAELVQRLVQVGVDVSFSPSFRRLPLSGITTSLFFGRDVLLLQTRSSLRRLPHRIVKRLFDIVFSLIGITLLAPLFIATTALIKLRHWSVPVLFGQKVIGRDGRPFPMWKFSTMVNNAHLLLEQVLKTNPALRQEWNETFKLRDDPRVLPGIGDFLRKTSLNELPQLFNVLMGDMSLVGPRPVKSAELVQFYGPAAQLYKTVRPGITGLWQVSGRSDTSYEERVNYDVWYILNWSLWYDIVILLRTVWAVLRRKGAY